MVGKTDWESYISMLVYLGHWLTVCLKSTLVSYRL